MMIPHKCPVCDGTGEVSRSPWVAGYVYGRSSSDCDCHACNGTGIVWEKDSRQTNVNIYPEVKQTNGGWWAS